VKVPIAACDAVIVEIPAPTTVIVLPEIVATLGLDDVNTQGAGELVVGGTSGMEPIPYVVVMLGKGPKIVKVVACAGAVDANIAMTIAKTAGTYDFRDKCILLLSSVRTDPLGFAR